MDTQWITTFAILIIALILFLNDKLPADLAALLVVVALVGREFLPRESPIERTLAPNKEQSG